MTRRSILRLAPAVALGWVWIHPAAWAQPRSVRTVLAVHFSSEDYPSNPVVDGAIRQVLLARDDAPVDYFGEYLESDRFPNEEATLAFRDYLQRKYHGRRIDVVVAITDPALQFVLQYRDQLFPDVPIVASASSALGPHLSAAGVTGAAWRAADVETIELALSLHPSTQRVFVVAQELTDGYLESAQAALAKSVGHVELKFIKERSVPNLIAAVRAVPPQSLIHFIRFSREDPGNVLFPQEVIRMVAEASPVPVYVSTDSLVGTGAVGGVVRLAPGIGTRVGQIALRVLDGTPPQNIPIEDVPVLPLFDWREVQRWGIDASRLPPGSEIRFRVPTVWELYRWFIVGALTLVGLQGLMIAALVVERSRRRESQKRYVDAQAELARVSRLRALGEFAASIAHEIRQPLNSIILNAHTCLRWLNDAAPDLTEVRAALSDVVDAGRRAEEQIRRNRELFRHSTVQKEPIDIADLVHEVAVLAAPRLKKSQIALTTTLASGLPVVIGDRIELQQVLLNLVLNSIEATENVQAGPRRIEISTSLTPEEAVKVAVRDNGVGLKAVDMQRLFTFSYTTKVAGTGIGLSLSRSIVEAHDGRLWAEQNADAGATFAFTIPVHAYAAHPKQAERKTAASPDPPLVAKS